MSKENRHLLQHSEKPFSLLQSNNELFVNKILSRNSSFGRSARLAACRLPGQIPFNWEAQPGLPKHQPSEIPPPVDLPPPACSGEGLSIITPHIVPAKQEAVKIWFWRKPKRKVRNIRKNGAFGSSSRRHVDRGGEFCRKSNDESSSLSCISYSLSSGSSSGSSSNGYGQRRSKLGSLAKGFIRWAF